MAKKKYHSSHRGLIKTNSHRFPEEKIHEAYSEKDYFMPGGSEWGLVPMEEQRNEDVRDMRRICKPRKA